MDEHLIMAILKKYIASTQCGIKSIKLEKRTVDTKDKIFLVTTLDDDSVNEIDFTDFIKLNEVDKYLENGKYCTTDDTKFSLDNVLSASKIKELVDQLKETKADIANLANGRQYKGKVDYKNTSSTGYTTGKTVLPTSGNVVGDYWLVAEDNHYYQWNTSSKWDDVGSGDEGYNKVSDKVTNLFPIDINRTNFFCVEKNVYTTVGMTDGYIILPESGKMYARSGYSATDYLDITGFTRLYRNISPEGAFYDYNKIYCGRINYGVKEIDVPLNAKYVRIGVVTEYKDFDTNYISNVNYKPVSGTFSIVDTDVRNGFENVVNNLITDATASQFDAINANTNKSIQRHGAFYNLTSVVAPYDNLNTIPVNSIVTYGGFNTETNILNFPSSDFTWGATIITYAGRTVMDGATQIAISRTGKMAFRVYTNDAWINWQYPMLKSEKSFLEFGMFQDFGVIGDSYASGAIYTGTSWIQNYAVSWGQVLARKVGAKCVNYSDGGLTTRTWLTNSKGLSLLNSSKPNQLYFLNLGINDVKLGIEYIGNVTDMDDADNYDTFYGNYGKIIDAIKVHAPNAKIVISRILGGQANTTEFNAAVSVIANKKEIPLLNTSTNPYLTTGIFWSSQSSGHPVASTYSGMATAYKELMEKAMLDNIDYFNNITKSEY